MGRELDITVVGVLAAMARPKAMIHVQSSFEAEDGQDQDYALVVRMSPSRLRIMLGNGLAADAVLAHALEDGQVHIPVVNVGLVRRIIEEIHRAPSGNAAYHLYLQSKIIELLFEVTSAPAIGDRERLAIEVRNILLANPANPPTMPQLARQVGIPARKLNALYQARFGLSITEWLVEWRLLRARDLVLEGDLPINEIAASIGYAHMTTFSAAFAKRFGVAPTRLRAGQASASLPHRQKEEQEDLHG